MSYDDVPPDFEAIFRYYDWLEQCHPGATKGRPLKRKATIAQMARALPDYRGQSLEEIRRARFAAIAANAFLPILPKPSTVWLRFDSRYAQVLAQVIRDAAPQAAYRERGKFSLELDTVNALVALHRDHTTAGIDLRMDANGGRVTKYNFECALTNTATNDVHTLGRAL